jgi:hypothetical protein
MPPNFYRIQSEALKKIGLNNIIHTKKLQWDKNCHSVQTWVNLPTPSLFLVFS